MTGGLVRLRDGEAFHTYVQVTADVIVSPVGSIREYSCLAVFMSRGPYDTNFRDNVNTHLLLPLGAL